MDGTTNDTNTGHVLMLLTQQLGNKPAPDCEPLNSDEMVQLEHHLAGQGKVLSDLVSVGWAEVLSGHPESERVSQLLQRGWALGMATTNWQTLGIVPICRHEALYPEKLRDLGAKAPPVIYCIGDVSALNAGYTAIMAPRTRDQAVVDYARQMGKVMGKAKAPLATGTGRATENALMEEAFSESVPVLGVMRSSLQLAATDRRYRRRLMDGQLTLVSGTDPAGRQPDRETDALLSALSKRTVVIDPGPPPAWRDAVPQE